MLGDILGLYGTIHNDFMDRLGVFLKPPVSKGNILLVSSDGRKAKKQIYTFYKSKVPVSLIDTLRLQGIYHDLSVRKSYGLYDRSFDFICLRENTVETMAATLVHELVHKWQHENVLLSNMSLFDSEFEAVCAEYEFAKMFPLRPSLVDKFCVAPHLTKEDLARFVRQHYACGSIPQHIPLFSMNKIFL